MGAWPRVRLFDQPYISGGSSFKGIGRVLACGGAEPKVSFHGLRHRTTGQARGRIPGGLQTNLRRAPFKCQTARPVLHHRGLSCRHGPEGLDCIHRAVGPHRPRGAGLVSQDRRGLRTGGRIPIRRPAARRRRAWTAQRLPLRGARRCGKDGRISSGRDGRFGGLYDGGLDDRLSPRPRRTRGDDRLRPLPRECRPPALWQALGCGTHSPPSEGLRRREKSRGGDGFGPYGRGSSTRRGARRGISDGLEASGRRLWLGGAAPPRGRGPKGWIGLMGIVADGRRPLYGGGPMAGRSDQTSTSKISGATTKFVKICSKLLRPSPACGLPARDGLPAPASPWIARAFARMSHSLVLAGG